MNDPAMFPFRTLLALLTGLLAPLLSGEIAKWKQLAADVKLEKM